MYAGCFCATFVVKPVRDPFIGCPAAAAAPPALMRITTHRSFLPSLYLQKKDGTSHGCKLGACSICFYASSVRNLCNKEQGTHLDGLCCCGVETPKTVDIYRIVRIL